MKYFVLLSVLLLIACAKPPVETIVQTKFITQSIPIQQQPRSVNMRDVEFYVVTENNFEEFKTKFTAVNGDLVFVALSIKGYENMSLNLANLHRYIKQQKEIIIYYEKSVK